MDKKMMEKFYGEYLETRAAASADVGDALKGMQEAFERYLDAIGEDEFNNAFMFGYAYGLKAAQFEAAEGGNG